MLAKISKFTFFVILVYICPSYYNKLIFVEISPFQKNMVWGGGGVTLNENYKQVIKMKIWLSGPSSQYRVNLQMAFEQEFFNDSSLANKHCLLLIP